MIRTVSTVRLPDALPDRCEPLRRPPEGVAELVAEFDQLPRLGETVYGFAGGVYPTDHPTLPGSGE
jgi:hypothetical protein